MKPSEEKFLLEVLERAGFDFQKVAESNPLENSMFENMIDGALKALEVVSVATFDWKLVGIVKLLQSWLKDRREEKALHKKQQEYGISSSYY